MNTIAQQIAEDIIAVDGELDFLTNRELVKLIAARTQPLEDALRDLFLMMDEGLLVRDISGDGRPDWAFMQLSFVKRLATAQAALAATAKGAR